MRISTQVFFQRNVNSVLEQQSTLNQQNIHLSSQKRVIHGADDPVAIATIQRLKQEVSVGEQYLQNADRAEIASSLEDIALSQATNILQRVRELMVTAGNETHNEDSREIIAKELEGLREELIGVGNTQDGNSQYIFSGFDVDTKPFQANEFGEIDYHGDSGTTNYKVGAGVLVQGYDSGSTVFAQIDEGNGTFVSEANSANAGSGVISEGTVVDKNFALNSTKQDYTITVSELAGEPAYSVYGLYGDETAVAGNANITITDVDTNDPNIGSVDPTAGSEVIIDFIETSVGADTFQVRINGEISSVNYDINDDSTHAITVNGITIEVDGIPETGDAYTMTKYIEPTLYQEGQSIEFNGIKTEMKGDVQDGDTFTLRQSDEKDIFSTIQDTIDSLRIIGEDGPEKAQRLMAIGTGLLQIDNSMSNISSVHTSVGTRLNTIDNQREATLDFNLANQKTLSSLEDLDMAAALSDFNMQMSMLEISQQTFIQIQSLSLFKLI